MENPIIWKHIALWGVLAIVAIGLIFFFNKTSIEKDLLDSETQPLYIPFVWVVTGLFVAIIHGYYIIKRLFF